MKADIRTAYSTRPAAPLRCGWHSSCRSSISSVFSIPHRDRLKNSENARRITEFSLNKRKNGVTIKQSLNCRPHSRHTGWNTTRNTVILVNGCFWHGHKGCKYYTIPLTKVEFWTDKVSKNKERDALNNQRLESLSWSIITIWECELKSKAFDATIACVISELHQNKSKWEVYQAKRRSDHEFVRSEARRKRQIRAEVECDCRSSYTFR